MRAWLLVVISACGGDQTIVLPDLAATPDLSMKKVSTGCQPDCSGKACGDDGCHGACGSCPGAAAVCGFDNQCHACQPDCTNRECGDDGCGGNCGTCPTEMQCRQPGHCEQLPCTASGVSCTAGFSCFRETCVAV